MTHHNTHRNNIFGTTQNPTNKNTKFMVIQRWQTLLLLAAAILMVAINFSPLASLGASQKPDTVFTTDFAILMIVDGLVAVLLFLGIFLFKNLQLQIKVTVLSIVLMCVLAVTGGIVLYRQSAIQGIEWSGAVLLLICALILAMGALRLQKRDRNLLRSADRLR